MKWLYDACGYYFDYKGHVVIKQDHPNLDKYAVYYEDKSVLNSEKDEDSLIFIGTASTISGAKEVVNDELKKLKEMENENLFDHLKYTKFFNPDL